MRKVKGKINNGGILEIERAGKFKKQECRETGDFWCDDECSLFGEPEPEIQYDLDTEKESPTGRTCLSLCKKAWIFDEFEDKR